MLRVNIQLLRLLKILMTALRLYAYHVVLRHEIFRYACILQSLHIYLLSFWDGSYDLLTFMYSSGSSLRSSQISYHLHCVFHSPFVATNTSSTPTYNYISTRVQLQLFKRSKVNDTNQLLPASLAIVVTLWLMGRGQREGSREGLKTQRHMGRLNLQSEPIAPRLQPKLKWFNDSNPGEISQTDCEKDRRLGWVQPRKKQYVSVTSLCAFKLEGMKDCLAMQFAVGR